MALGAKIPAPLVYGNEAAPFIYFDGCYVLTPLAGNDVAIELAARTFVPTSATDDAPLKVKPISVAHLRCSLQAASQLRDILNNLFKEKPASTN
jgi:hypothetical protein